MKPEIKHWGTFYAERHRPDGPNFVFTNGLEIYTLSPKHRDGIDVRIGFDGSVSVVCDNPTIQVRDL